MLDQSWLLIAIPLAGAALLLMWGKESDKFGHLIATACSAASFVLGLTMFIQLAGRDPDDRSATSNLGTWIQAGNFSVDFQFTFDTLSSLFVLLITGVGTPSSTASTAVQRPSPESATTGAIDSRRASSARNSAVKSSSHDRITVP